MSSMTVVVSMAIRRRGGRKQIIGPDGAPLRASGNEGETRGDPALVKGLARAFRWRRLLEDGRYASIRELAAAEQVDRAYVGRLLNLTLLPPEMVEDILDGRDVGIRVSTSRQVGPPVACLWCESLTASSAAPYVTRAGRIPGRNDRGLVP